MSTVGRKTNASGTTSACAPNRTKLSSNSTEGSSVGHFKQRTKDRLARREPHPTICRAPVIPALGNAIGELCTQKRPYQSPRIDHNKARVLTPQPRPQTAAHRDTRSTSATHKQKAEVPCAKAIQDHCDNQRSQSNSGRISLVFHQYGSHAYNSDQSEVMKTTEKATPASSRATGAAQTRREIQMPQIRPATNEPPMAAGMLISGSCG